MRSRKAMLYVPGSDLHKIEKAAAAGSDCVCLDLEDGVAESMKTEARSVIAAALQSQDFGRSERMVRVNSFASGRTLDDLAAVLPAHPDAIHLPKVFDPDQITEIDSLLYKAEADHGWEEFSIALVVNVESARGIVNLESICHECDFTPRFQGVVFRREDFTADVGAPVPPKPLNCCTPAALWSRTVRLLACRPSTWSRSISRITRCWNANRFKARVWALPASR